MAVKSINRGDKYEKKGKNEKAVKHYKKAFKLLLASNKEYPSETDTLAYLGYTNKKLGNFEDAEIYYLMGLEIAPNHFKINKYLGELYLDSNKIVLAKERLEILKNCNCREFKELDNLIKLTASK